MGPALCITRRDLFRYTVFIKFQVYLIHSGYTDCSLTEWVAPCASEDGIAYTIMQHACFASHTMAQTNARIRMGWGWGPDPVWKITML